MWIVAYTMIDSPYHFLSLQNKTNRIKDFFNRILTFGMLLSLMSQSELEVTDVVDLLEHILQTNKQKKI